MFEYLENNSLLQRSEPATQESKNKIQRELGKLAPDFVEFIEKFGEVDIGDGHFRFYGWIENLADYFETNMGERPEVDAWLFGDDYSGDFHAIDKKTGEVVFISAGYLEVDEIRFPSFEKFIHYLLRE